MFERFLSERRTSLPDIDLDVESARRLEVYDKIIERFRSERVAVTGMPETYRARHALRFPVKFSVLSRQAKAGGSSSGIPGTGSWLHLAIGCSWHP